MAKEAPCCRQALTDATKRWPRRNRASDGIIGDAAHRARKSDHNPDSSGYAHAFDLTHDPANGPDCHVLADQLTKSDDPRIKYIIFYHRIWYPTKGNRPKGWSRYTGENPHTKHMHVSIHASARDNVRPWPWSGVADKAIQELQNGLATLGYLKTAEVTGVRDAKTIVATKVFQRDNDLEPDGIAGPLTRKALSARLAKADKG